jgi:hypothetical protein
MKKPKISQLRLHFIHLIFNLYSRLSKQPPALHAANCWRASRLFTHIRRLTYSLVNYLAYRQDYLRKQLTRMYKEVFISFYPMSHMGELMSSLMPNMGEPRSLTMPNMGEFVNFPAVLRSSSPPMIHFLGAHVGRFLLVLLPLNVSDKMLSAMSCYVLYGFYSSANSPHTPEDQAFLRYVRDSTYLSSFSLLTRNNEVRLHIVVIQNICLLLHIVKLSNLVHRLRTSFGITATATSSFLAMNQISPDTSSTRSNLLLTTARLMFYKNLDSTIAAHSPTT